MQNEGDMKDIVPETVLSDKNMDPQHVPHIYPSLEKVMSEIKAISKSQKNEQQNFMYRGVDDVYNELHDLFAKHSILLKMEILEDKSTERTSSKGSLLIYKEIKVLFHLISLVDGSVLTQGPVIGEGMDSGDKSSNKAMSVAAKYALLILFVIPTSDPKDPDAESHEVANKPIATKSNFKSWTGTPKATAPVKSEKKDYKKGETVLMNGIAYTRFEFPNKNGGTNAVWYPPKDSGLPKYNGDVEFNDAYERSTEGLNTINPDEIPV